MIRTLLSCCALSLALVACSTPPAYEVAAAPPLIRTTLAAAGVDDARQRFQSIFCQITAAVGRSFPDYRPCEEALMPASAGSARGQADSPPPEPATPVTVVFVSGLFGECVDAIASPFGDSYLRLRSAGFRVLNVPVEGRSSSQRNAGLIDTFLSGQIGPHENVVVIGHSKGVVDMLQALGDFGHRTWVSRIRALVSVAGAIMGSAIADQYASTYEGLAASLPFPTCAPGDGGAVNSLTSITRAMAMQAFEPPGHVLLFSLAAVADPARVNALLSTFHARLSRLSPRNDGQLLAQDAILPGSIFLGYALADHWAVALPFNRSDSAFAAQLAGHNAYPREVLLDSLLAMVQERLRARSGVLRAD